MDDLQRLAARLITRWERFTRSQRFAVMTVCTAGAVGILLFWNPADNNDWQPITTGRDYSANELTAIQSAWRKQGLTGFRRDGKMLKVPQADFAKYQAAMPQTVTAQSISTDEWDRQLSNVNPFTTSEQLEQRKDIALRTELRRVLKAIPAIADADVIWARGKSRTPFGGRSKVTATVNITPDDGHDITPDLAQSLRAAVASMIADLNPADIVVLDQSSGMAVPYEPDAAWTARLQQRQVERTAKQLERQLTAALSHFGDVSVKITNAEQCSIQVSVPDSPLATTSEIRDEVSKLLPVEFANAKIRVTTRLLDAANTATQPAPFTAWPHMICAGIAAMCVIFGLRPRTTRSVSQTMTSRRIIRDETETTEAASRPSRPTTAPLAADQTSVTTKTDATEILVPDALTQLQATPASELAVALRTERPQAIAVLATRLPSRLVSDTLGQLSTDTQIEVIRRLKSLGGVPDELVTEIARAVVARLHPPAAVRPINRIAALIDRGSPLERAVA